mmetsp:Transcript_30386/g.88860  ORF Transcript_30386/g.88860 Transcript_30386/m.88860 type:complete len:427 (-) Transcript_30386:144-1424(-)
MMIIGQSNVPSSVVDMPKVITSSSTKGSDTEINNGTSPHVHISRRTGEGGETSSRAKSGLAISFGRRCSLDFIRQNSPTKPSESKASRRRPRRSSLKSTVTNSTSLTSTATSFSTASTTSAAPTKVVTFSLDVAVRPIAQKNNAELNACWLSKDERQAIQLQAMADLKTLKAISRLPKDVQASDPEVLSLRSSISIRGLEQFSSKRLHHALFSLQHDHLWSVLQAQEEQRVLHRCYGIPMEAQQELAKVSADRSRTSRDRASRQGREDELAVLGYLGRFPSRRTDSSVSPSSSSQNNTTRPKSSTAANNTNRRRAPRRGSMPTTPFEKALVLPRPSAASSTFGLLTRSTSVSKNDTGKSNRTSSGAAGGNANTTTATNVNATVDAKNSAEDDRGPSGFSHAASSSPAVLLEPFVYPRLRGNRRNST